MDTNDVNNKKIDELVARVLNVPLEAISGNMTPGDLVEWDSLNHLMLITAIEAEFAIDIDPEEIIQMYAGYESFKSIVTKKLSFSVGR
jgi:acyl carrier protein